ncbi:MAG: hypothetical protein ACTSWQ_05840 [Candidatus Thorarchaeota archaeon]
MDELEVDEEDGLEEDELVPSELFELLLDQLSYDLGECEDQDVEVDELDVDGDETLELLLDVD